MAKPGKMDVGVNAIIGLGVSPKPVRTVYISGPMTGLDNYNFDLFDEVAFEIRRNGLTLHRLPPTVLNPAENFGGDQTLPREKYLAAAVRQVTEADALVLLPGWRSSEGAKLEIEVALATGKRFFVAQHVHLAYDATTSWQFSEATAPGIRVECGLSDTGEPGTIEQEASGLVRNGARQKTYGHPRGDFDRVAGMWSALLGIKVTAEDVAVMMIAFKLARLKQTPQHHDTKVDVIGYAICLDRLDEADAPAA